MEDTSEATLIDIIFSSNKAWGTRDKTDGTGNIFATSSTPKLFLVGMSMPLLSMGVVPIGSNPLPNGNGCCNLCLSVGCSCSRVDSLGGVADKYAAGGDLKNEVVAQYGFIEEWDAGRVTFPSHTVLVDVLFDRFLHLSQRDIQNKS